MCLYACWGLCVENTKMLLFICTAESAFLPYEILAIARLIVMDAAAFNAALKLAASQLSVTDENAETEEVKAQKALLNCGREHAETAWATACNLMEKILERCQSGLSSVKATSITLKDELDATVRYCIHSCQGLLVRVGRRIYLFWGFGKRATLVWVEKKGGEMQQRNFIYIYRWLLPQKVKC